MSNGLRGTGRKLGRPQRIPLDDHREPQQLDERDDMMLRARGEWDVHVQEEKENIISSPDGTEGLSSDGGAQKRISPRLASRSASLSQVDGRAISGLPTRAYGSSLAGANAVSRPPLQPGRQIIPGPNRAGRVLKGTKYGVGAGGFDKINEHEGSESEVAYDYAGEETDTGSCARLEVMVHAKCIHRQAATSRSPRMACFAIGATLPLLHNQMARVHGDRQALAMPLAVCYIFVVDAGDSEPRPAEGRHSPGAQSALPTNQNLYTSRPGSSLGLNSARVRRVTTEQEG
jgi:hypothetical protein